MANDQGGEGASTNGRRAQNRAASSAGRSFSGLGPQGRSLLATLAASHALRASGSDLVSRRDFANAYGYTFGGLRNLDSALGYQPTLTPEDYQRRYERNGLADRIIEFLPSITWGEGADIVEDPINLDDETEFEQQTRELFERLDVWSRLLRADILCGLGEYSVIIIGDGEDLQSELGRLNGPDSIITLATLPQTRAKIDKEVDNLRDPRFGLPEYYQCKLSRTVTKLVHWSRVIHVAQGLLVDDVHGKPVLRPIWNYLDDLQKVTGGGSEAAWKRMDPGTQVDYPLFGPDGKVLEVEDESDLEEQVDELIHGMRRVIYTRGTKLTQLEAQVAAFGGNADTIISLICATYGIPQRILMGSERGELASTEDKDNLNDRRSERRTKFAEPLTRSFIGRLIEHGGLVDPVDGYEIQWPEEEELSQEGKASVASTLATANKNQKDAGDTIIVTSNEIRDSILGLEALDPAEIERLEGGDVDDEEEDTDALDGGDDDDPAVLRASEFDLADTPSDEPEWRSIHRAADSHYPSLARAVAGVWQDAAEDIDTDLLESALSRLDVEAAEQIVTDALKSAESTMQSMMDRRLLAVLIDGGMAALRSARSRGGFRANATTSSDLRAMKFSATFDATNPRAVSYAQARSSALVTEIGPDTRAALRELISVGIRDGLAPRKLRQLVRQSVGLRTDQYHAVTNLRGRLKAASPGRLIRAGKVRIRVPKSGASASFIDSHAARYAQRLRNQRALLIARTESLRAANEGQRELWRQARDSGQLPTSQHRVWIETPDERLRDSHSFLAGQERGLDEPFHKSDGSAIEPGQEPNCRCAQGLV